MNTLDIESKRDLVERLIAMECVSENGVSVYDLIDSFYGSDTEWKPIDGVENNRGDVRFVDTDVEAIAEYISNHVDAYIYEGLQNGDASTRAEAIAHNPEVDIELEVFGSDDEFGFMSFDSSIGVSQTEFENAFCLNPSEGGMDKVGHSLLSGDFGQGSYSGISVSNSACRLVLSSFKEEDIWSWTITRYNEEKTSYEYLTVNDSIPVIEGDISPSDNIAVELDSGTITKVFDIDRLRTPYSVFTDRFQRELGYEIPNCDIPIQLHDYRADTRSKSEQTGEWSGIIPELRTSNAVTEYTKKITTDEFGVIPVSVFVIDEDEKLTEFITTAEQERCFFTVDGRTHHQKTLSDFNWKVLDDDCLVFVECDNLTVPPTDIFRPDRTSFTGAKAEVFDSVISEQIREWNKLNTLDINRFDVSKILSQSPVRDFSGSKMKLSDDGESTLSIDCCIDLSDTVSNEYIDTSVELELNADDTTKSKIEWSQFTVTGSEVTLEFSISWADSERVFCGSLDAYDTEFGTNESLSIVVENNNSSQLIDAFMRADDTEKQEIQEVVTSAKQSERSNSGINLEKAVYEDINERKLPYGVEVSFTRSDLPTGLQEQLDIDILGEFVTPDTDLIIHTETDIVGVISCKRSLRERLSQTGFWHLLAEYPFFVVTTDPDNELEPHRKAYKLAGATQGVFVRDVDTVEGTGKVYPFDELESKISEVVSIDTTPDSTGLLEKLKGFFKTPDWATSQAPQPTSEDIY